MDGSKGRTEESQEASRLIYREDDRNFKQRLNTAIQIGWVFNTALTVMVVMGIFYILGFQLVLGLIMSILVAFFSNFRFLLIQISKSARWEVYRNKVIMPRGGRGGNRVIMFSDIDSIERRKTGFVDKVIIQMRGGSRFSVDVSGQEAPLQCLLMTFNQYSIARARRSFEIRFPVVVDDPDQEE